MSAPMSDSARDLIDASVRASGGAERWSRLTGLRFSMRGRGLLLAFRGRSPLWQRYTVEISTREPRAVLSPFGPPGGRGVFAGDTVHIETASGEKIAERRGARAHARDHLLWDDLDLVHLLGYSFWNYLNIPFIFHWDGFRAVELAPWRDPATGQTLRRLRIQYPPHLPTHWREQLFYFDDRALVVRFDYGAEVFHPRFRGAHLCLDYHAWSGIMLPSHRRAVPYGLGARPIVWWPSMMEAKIDDVEPIEG